MNANIRNTENKSKNDAWGISVPDFPAEKRAAVKKVAAEQRMHVGPFIASLLEKLLEDEKNKPARAANN